MSEDALEHPIYRYGHSRFERWIVQLTVQFPAYILLLWMAIIACILVRSFANGMVDLKVTAVIVLLIGVGCFIALNSILVRDEESYHSCLRMNDISSGYLFVSMHVNQKSVVIKGV